MILCVVFVVLMMFWLFFGGYPAYTPDRFNLPAFGGTIILWLCVAILGYIIGPLR